jgi:prepilin-type N-terminal cleavage/methylation domain-containing protein
MIDYLNIKSVRKLEKNSGVNLIELMFVMLISGIVLAALVSVYYYGIVSFYSVSSQYQMLSEGTSVLDSIGRSISQADSVYVDEASDSNRTRLFTYYSSSQKKGSYEYFYNFQDKILKMNDLLSGHNDYNITILPVPPSGSSFSRMKKPFDVRTVYFQRADDDNNPNAWTVKVDVVLEGTRGDILALSRTATRFILED